MSIIRNSSDKYLDCYRMILSALMLRRECVVLKDISHQEVNDIIKLVLDDNPQIFWFEGDWSQCSSKEHESICFHYMYTKEQIDSMQDQINEKLNTFDKLSDMPQHESIRYIYDWLVDHVEYGTEGGSEGQNICDALVNQKALCKGISKALQLMLQKVGIASCLAEGSLDGNSRHMWNIVELDGKNYHIDVSMAYDRFSNLFPELEKANRYRSFLVSDKTIRRTHRISETESLPECMEDFIIKRDNLERSTDTEKSAVASNSSSFLSTVSLLEDTVLRERYSIKKLLGQGGFGITYLAYDRIGHKQVAVKEFFPCAIAERADNHIDVLPVSPEQSVSFVAGKQAFAGEVRTLQMLSNSEIRDWVVCPFDCFYENGTAYSVMEYVQGKNLVQYMRERGVLSPEDACRLLFPLMKALHFIHEQGMIHGDISPDNIIVLPTGKAKLIDFRAERQNNDGAKTQLKHGFAPVEMYTVRGKTGPFTDVYEMGATYYYLMTGHVLPHAIDRLDDDTVRKPSTLGLQISRATEDVLMKAISPQPRNRYSNMLEFYNALSCADVQTSHSAPSARDSNVNSSGGLFSRFRNVLAGKRVTAPKDDTALAGPKSEEKQEENLQHGSMFHADPISQSIVPPGSVFIADPIAYSCAMEPLSATESPLHTEPVTPPNAMRPFESIIKMGNALHVDPADEEESIIDLENALHVDPTDEGESMIIAPESAFHADPIAYSCAMEPSDMMLPVALAPSQEAEEDEGHHVNPDRVRFSAVAPKEITKGDYGIINIVMYEELYRNYVDELIRDADGPVKEAKSGFFQISHHTAVKIVLQSPDLEIEDNELTQIYSGGFLDFSFYFQVPENYRKRQILFIAKIYVDDVILTRLQFITQCDAGEKQVLSIERHDILSAFVSYASQDRKRVATIIQGMKRVRPDLDVFFDVDNLRAGDDWQEKLSSEITKRDVLYLCWSRFAKESKWVDMEWRYALERKGIDFIEPIPLDIADRCPPPQELQGKSFNDKLLYIINFGQ